MPSGVCARGLAATLAGQGLDAGALLRLGDALPASRQPAQWAQEQASRHPSGRFDRDDVKFSAKLGLAGLPEEIALRLVGSEVAPVFAGVSET